MPSKLGPSVAILCMALACRQPDDHTGAPRVDAPAADIGCIQTAGVRPDTTIRPGDSVKAAAWHAAYDRGREYRCVVSTAMPPYRVMVTHDSMTEVDAISF